MMRALDAAGWTRSSTDQLGFITTQSFDADGNLLTVRDPNVVGQDCLYDSRNRRIQCTDTAGTVTLTGYDFNSNVVSMTDGLGHVTTMAFDARERKVTTTDRLGGVTRFTYDPTSNLLTITDAQGAVTAYTFDARNLLLSETYPPGQATPGSPTTPPLDQRVYVYDAARRLASRLDQAGVLTTYAYDLASRLGGRLYSDGLGNDAFGYDPASRLINASSGRYGTVVTRSYTDHSEKAGRLTSEVQTVAGIPETVAYAYDAANRPVGVTYPSGSAVGYTIHGEANGVLDAEGNLTTTTYDTVGRPLVVTAPTVAIVDPSGYDPGGQIQTTTTYAKTVKNTVTDANGTVTQFTYDARNRLFQTVLDLNHDGVFSTAFGGPDIVSQTVYNLVDKPVQVTDSKGNSTTTTYDYAYRVTAVAQPQVADAER
jgi:YD repeat-containing protein